MAVSQPGANLARSHQTLVLERELFGGNLQHAAQIDDYAAYRMAYPGANLAAALIEEATTAGATLSRARCLDSSCFAKPLGRAGRWTRVFLHRSGVDRRVAIRTHRADK